MKNSLLLYGLGLFERKMIECLLVLIREILEKTLVWVQLLSWSPRVWQQRQCCYSNPSSSPVVPNLLPVHPALRAEGSLRGYYWLFWPETVQQALPKIAADVLESQPVCKKGGKMVCFAKLNERPISWQHIAIFSVALLSVLQ